MAVGAGNKTDTQGPSSSFITYDISDGKMIGTHTGGPSDRVPSFEGVTFVPNWGDRGILVAAGGSQDKVGGNNDQGMQTVHVYDIDEQRWYDQTTSGDIPEARRDFCMAGAPSSNRTHEILVYAGWNGELGPDAVRYDSAYVLTLPGFYWVKADYPAAHPRHGLTCNAVGGSQILTIGGVDTTQQAGDGAGQHAAGFTTRDPFDQGVAIFDMGSLTWSSAYHARRSLQPPAAKIQAYYNAK